MPRPRSRRSSRGKKTARSKQRRSRASRKTSRSATFRSSMREETEAKKTVPEIAELNGTYPFRDYEAFRSEVTRMCSIGDWDALNDYVDSCGKSDEEVRKNLYIAFKLPMLESQLLRKSHELFLQVEREHAGDLYPFRLMYQTAMEIDQLYRRKIVQKTKDAIQAEYSLEDKPQAKLFLDNELAKAVGRFCETRET